MGFAGAFLIVFFILLAIVLISTLVSIILFIVYRVQKSRKGKSNTVLKATGCFFLIPLVLSLIGILVFSVIKDYKETHSLAHCVMYQDYKNAEKLLKKGVSPDCTLKSNAPAKEGEKTLLWILSADGFVDLDFEDRLTEQDPEEVYRMAELLIKYNADVNFSFSCGSDKKHVSGEYHDMFLSDGQCGHTPFLNAAANENYKLTELLIKNGADVNAVDNTGFNAISVLADEGSGDMDYLELLLKNDVKLPDKTYLGQDYAFLVYRNKCLENKDEFIKALNPVSDSEPADEYIGCWVHDDAAVIIRRDKGVYNACAFSRIESGEFHCWDYILEYSDGKMICNEKGNMYDGLDTGSKYATLLQSNVSAVFTVSENGMVWDDSAWAGSKVHMFTRK